jgi:hypothetical protein
MLPQALFSAGLASCTTLALAAGFSRLSGRNAAEPLNAVGSHVAGPGAEQRRSFSAEATLPGMLINYGGCLFWANVMERWAHEQPLGDPRDALFRGSIAAALAYLIDYHGLPRGLRPGYERKLSEPALLAVYASLAITLPLRAWVMRKSAHRR